jgi:hypothetical protein
LVINILFRKEYVIMAIVYAYLIIKGKREFKDVPAKLKEAVRQALINLDAGHLATELATEE